MAGQSNSVWLSALVCCVVPLAIFGLGFLAATAHYKGWIKIKVDTTKAPRLNWRRNQ